MLSSAPRRVQAQKEEENSETCAGAGSRAWVENEGGGMSGA